jgi:hypothetical protein
MKHISLPFLFIIGLILWLSSYQTAWAQPFPLSGSATCGIPDITSAQALSLVQEANLALQRKRASNAAFTAITYVPIRPHIIRRGDGTGGLTLAGMNQMLAYTNSHYLLNGFGIQFYFAGTTPDYIDSDQLYAGFPYGGSAEGAAINGRDATNAMNQYYIHLFSANIDGYAYYPYDDIISTRSFIGIGDGSQPVIVGNRTIAHELGHNFNLIHTHGPANDTPTDELVTRGAGANCSSAGDQICDTPADPYYVAGVNTISVNGCTQYDPNSTARDPNGEPYSPMMTNLMSYWANYCAYNFTPGQFERIQAGLALRQSHTTYTLNAPATNVTPISNLAATTNGTTITLTWQDNANNEMGYFIERSTSPNTGFLPIGGVAPDATSFTDAKITAETRFYYRVRPSNSTTGNLSSTITISTCPTPQYPSSSPARISATLYWTGNAGQTNTLRWRPVGNPNWTTIENIPNGQYSTNYTLTGLSSSTAYEWQVQGVCSNLVNSDFTDVQSFTTLACQPPSSISTSNVGSGSVQFFWYTFPVESGELADIRYRIVGTPTWTTISSLSTSTAGSGTSYTVSTGLSNNTTYEWQIRNICSTTESSTYTPSATFTTICRIPTGLSNTPTATQATLGWTVSGTLDPGATFDVRYRTVGSSVWNTVSNIVSNGSSLTGLSTSTQYEWQVRTACSANAQSDYSVTRQFTTICNPIFSSNSLTVVLRTSTSVRLRWNSSNDIGAPHDIRYRSVGSPDWIAISVTNTSAFGGSYDLSGLTNNTTYEWQVRSVCPPNQPSDFVAGPNFTTQCRIPSFLNSFPTMVTQATLSWEQTGTDVTYDIRYRMTGATDWVNLSNISSTSVIVTGLTGNTHYEWQVRTICHDGSTTDFSSLTTFVTNPCNSPGSLETTNITAGSAQLNWYLFNTDTHYDVRYRAVSAPNWTVLSNLSSPTLSGYLSLTGLSSATTYEWQIRSLCSATENSSFSSSITFQTLMYCPVMYTVKDGVWNDPTVWSCNRIPTSGDVVQIKHQVIVPASYVAILRGMGFDTGKTISYGTSAQVKVGF